MPHGGDLGPGSERCMVMFRAPVVGHAHACEKHQEKRECGCYAHSTLPGYVFALWCPCCEWGRENSVCVWREGCSHTQGDLYMYTMRIWGRGVYTHTPTERIYRDR